MITAPKISTPSVAPATLAPLAEKSAPAKTLVPKAPVAAAKTVKVVKAKPVKITPAVAVKTPAAAAQPAKLNKVKKPKLVRDSFTIPKAEYTVLDELKLRAVKLTQPAKKSELLRAGIKALAAMSDANLRAALQAVPAIKTGRPAADAKPTAVLTKPVAAKPAKKAAKKL